MNISIHHWQYSDGWNKALTRGSLLSYRDEFNEARIGWSCWVYTDENNEFLDWMKNSMKGSYSASPKFNSGNPMIIVHIKEDEDASFFKLTWL